MEIFQDISCVCVCCVHMHMCGRTQRDQKMMSDLLELELQAVLSYLEWELRIKLRRFERGVHTHLTIEPSLQLIGGIFRFHYILSYTYFYHVI